MESIETACKIVVIDSIGITLRVTVGAILNKYGVVYKDCGYILHYGAILILDLAYTV